jgi:dethiobiotin synthetase
VRGVFVTGTGTGVGKTVVAAAIAAAARARGERVAAHKPVLTGLDEPTQAGWPRDHELLASVTGQTPDDVGPLRFGPPVSPHLAAALGGGELDAEQLVERARAAAASCDLVVVEGVGGLLVPFRAGFAVRDLAVALGLPLVVAAQAGLGTINHTLLTLEAARAAGLAIAGVVLTPWPADPSDMERSNRATIEEAGAVEVAPFPFLDGPDPGALAAAGAGLPLERWLGTGRVAR